VSRYKSTILNLWNRLARPKFEISWLQTFYIKVFWDVPPCRDSVTAEKTCLYLHQNHCDNHKSCNEDLGCVLLYYGTMYSDGRLPVFQRKLLPHVWVLLICWLLQCVWNLKAHDAREGKWRGNWRMEWVASTLHTTSEHGVSNFTTADAHTSAASSWLNWCPCWFKWTRPFRQKTKSGFRACAITFQTRYTCWSSGVFDTQV